MGFDSDGVFEFRRAHVDLTEKGAKALIVDVRDNPGGLVSTAIDIADQFMRSGDIVHYEKQDQIFETHRAIDAQEDKIPIILLVNENSASASEILAGAWQDNHIATVVGTTTYGKGVAQTFGATTDGQQFKLSIFYFLTPDKHVINGTGITPEYVVRNSAGDIQQAALDAYNSFAPFAEATKPKPGDTGLNVYAAQQRLLLLGYKLNNTGTMDDATVQAIKIFQKEAGLYAYGTLDFSTMQKLDAEARGFANNASKEDLQLQKAVELATQAAK